MNPARGWGKLEILAREENIENEKRELKCMYGELHGHNLEEEIGKKEKKQVSEVGFDQ